MTPTERQRGGEGERISVGGPHELAAFRTARDLLAQHLVHTREVANGRDFLFSGPREALHSALRLLVEYEHRRGGGLQLDFAEIDDYFLLRVTGGAYLQESIARYFAAEGG